MSDTGGFPLVGGSPAFPGKNNVTRDSANSFGWENLNVGNLSVVGGYRNKATKDYSSIVGGSNNNASASYSSVFGGFNNLASGSYSFTGGGFGCTASAIYSSVCGGNSVSATGTASFVGGGYINSATGSYSAILGGQNQTTSNAYASVIGGLLTTASRYGEVAHGGYGVLSAGSSQHGWLMFSNQSTSATPLILYLNGSAATERAVLAAGSRWKCTVEIMAATTGAIDKSASWEYKFQIDRPTTAASTIIRTTPLLTLSDGSNAGAPPAGWSVAITADTTNGCPQIQVTGDTDTINWTCALHYVQTIRV